MNDDEEQFRSDDDEHEEDDQIEDSGPYCRHYADPDDCEEPCGRCDHACSFHSEECKEAGCDCEGWVWPEDAEGS